MQPELISPLSWGFFKTDLKVLAASQRNDSYFVHSRTEKTPAFGRTITILSSFFFSFHSINFFKNGIKNVHDTQACLMTAHSFFFCCWAEDGVHSVSARRSITIILYFGSTLIFFSSRNAVKRFVLTYLRWRITSSVSPTVIVCLQEHTSHAPAVAATLQKTNAEVIFSVCLWTNYVIHYFRLKKMFYHKSPCPPRLGLRWLCRYRTTKLMFQSTVTCLLHSSGCECRTGDENKGIRLKTAHV